MLRQRPDAHREHVLLPLAIEEPSSNAEAGMVVELKDALHRANGGLLVLDQVHLVQGVGLVTLEELGHLPQGLDRGAPFFKTAQTVPR